MPETQSRSYSQRQLLLPLLAVLSDTTDGRLATSQAIDAVAAKLDLSAGERKRRLEIGGGQYRAFDRDVRWAKQRAVLKGYLDTPGRGHWQITGKGRRALKEARPGVVITLYEGDDGAALWASCEDAAGLIEDGLVQCILTSPPYPLCRQKDYGNLDERAYVDWLTNLAAGWRQLLTPDGSLVLNLGDVFIPGRPEQSLYAERLLLRLVDDLGYRLNQRFEFFNPSKLPSPAEWVTVRRVRVKPALERIYWLSLCEHPYASNRNVLVPYSDRMRSLIGAGGQRRARRPSGHAFKDGAFAKDNGGAIPSNLIIAPNTESNGDYMRGCRAAGLPVHPARFPGAVPNFFIRLTTRPGDVVYDPFSGSGKTFQEARLLNRRCLTSERALDYAYGHMVRIGEYQRFGRAAA